MMKSVIDPSVKKSYKNAYESSKEFKLKLGSNEHLDFVSDMKTYHDEFINSLEVFTSALSKHYPSNKEDKETLLNDVKELNNLVEYIRMTYSDNKLCKKSFPVFINKLFIQSNDLLEFIYDLSSEKSFWDDEELNF